MNCGVYSQLDMKCPLWWCSELRLEVRSLYITLLIVTVSFFSLTMQLHDFLTGATAEGGGAIAFPVLTLAFKVPATTARDFAFMIQTVGSSLVIFFPWDSLTGMNSAAITVLLMGILVERHTLILASIGGSVGTIMCLEVSFDPLLNINILSVSRSSHLSRSEEDDFRICFFLIRNRSLPSQFGQKAEDVR